MGDSTMNKMRRRDAVQVQGGFSLVELLIAMVVTTIAIGAVLSLLLQSDVAFRTQPDMMERQQNIRAAMDLIMRDVANAGASLPLSAQVFSRTAPGVASPAGTATDILEMLTNSSGMDPVPACQDGGVNIRIMPSRANLLPGTPVVLMMDDGTYSLRTIVDITDDNSGAGACDSSTRRPRLNVRQGGDASGRNPSGGACGLDNYGMGTNTQGNNACSVTQVGFMEVVRYWIRVDDGVPVLVRTSSAGLAGTNPDQVIARGIEDMQVRYRRAADITAGYNGSDDSTLVDLPDLMTSPALPDSVTVEVQVELAARGAEMANAGANTTTIETSVMSTGGGNDETRAHRGRLVSRGTVRSALVQLSSVDQRWQ